MFSDLKVCMHWGAAWKVSSVSSHQMSGFNLSPRAWGKVMIQMPSPALWSSAFHKRERRTDRVGGKPFCSCVGSPLFPPTNIILIYNERACPTEWGLNGWLGGETSRDDQRHLRMAGRIYLLTVALRWLNISQSASCLWDHFSKMLQLEPSLSSHLLWSPLLSPSLLSSSFLSSSILSCPLFSERHYT